MTGGLLVNVLCLVAAVAGVVGLIRLRLAVGRLHGLPSVPDRRGGDGEHDAHPRELDVADDGDDGDGGGDA
ncbi:hypothetical protein [Asanoa siamensis]|uniref:hypothetical protein n=1 Tax=Asanoa siamensis TaxID=926357 RepID=UPI001945894A|nr:hypothetical protein [Asanoa siamensis]